MEHLGAPAQGLFEAGRHPTGHDHKLLRVHGVGGVCAAVQDVHHGHGQAVAIHAAQKTVQGISREVAAARQAAMETARMAFAPRLDLSLVPSARSMAASMA